MVPELTRRRLLAGGAGLGAAGLAGATTRIDVGSLETWTPVRDAWPHDRYDLRNANANPRASPPADPTVAWRARPVESVQSVVVDPERVYVGGEVDEGGPGVAALDRTAGEVLWTADADGAALALRRGTLYAAAGRSEPRVLTAFDAETGAELWREPAGDVRGVVVADGTVFAGGHWGLTALDAETGRTRWTGAGGLPAIADGALFVSGGGLRRYRPRRVSDVLIREPPPEAWRARGGGTIRPPVVAGDRAVVGRGLPSRSADGNVHAFDPETGEREWTAAASPADAYPVTTGSPAVRRGRGFFAYRQGRRSERYHALVACSLADGTERWRWESPDWVVSVAAGGETVLAGTSGDDDTPGAARHGLFAFTLDGERRWSFDAEGAVRGLAAVADELFVGTGDGTSDATPGVVYALR